MRALILAAGIGKRMRSKTPKIAHSLLGRPLLLYAAEAVCRAADEGIWVVIGPRNESIRDFFPEAGFLVQDQPLGTGQAASLIRNVPGAADATWLILPGDIPCIRPSDLEKITAFHQTHPKELTVGTTVLEDPSGYGRIVRDQAGKVARVVEETDADSSEKKIGEINAGIYVARGDLLLGALDEISPHNRQKEYYLTDVIGILTARGIAVHPCPLPSEAVGGVNDRIQLAKAAAILRERKNRQVMVAGVTLVDPEATYLDWEVEIGEDTRIEPGALVLGKTKIGRDCLIDSGCRISDSIVDDNVHLKTGSILEGAVCRKKTIVGPMARLRPGTVLDPNVTIGNFVEIKNSTVGEGTKIAHLSYIGDATIGKDVNIGAGTITCNYDGKKKHPTFIEDGVFVGSDTQFVAPVRVGRGAVIGAGSTITEDVPPESLALARSRQETKIDWVRKRKSPPGGEGK